MKLSVIMPAYNEAPTIGQALKRLLAQRQVYEVVVVDDGSNDDTIDEINKVKSNKIRVFNQTLNQGKGAAVRYGLGQVRGDYVLIHDADLEYDPADIPDLVKPILEGKANIVYGSRFTGPHRNMFFWHMMGNKLLSFLVNILFNTTLSDMETCYKVLPTGLLKKINLVSNDFAIEPEITCKVLKRGEYIYEVPISYAGRSFEEGKKITWKDGVRAIGMILKIKLSL